MRWRRIFIVLCLCLVAIGVARQRLRRWRNARSADAIERRAGLDRRVAELNWDGVSLETAVDQLRKLAGARIEMSKEVKGTATDYHLPLTLPMHARLRNVKLSTALGLLADAASARDLDLVHAARPDGTVLLLDRSSAERIVGTYDVRDMASDALGSVLTRSVEPEAWAFFPNSGAPQLRKVSDRMVVIATRPEHACVAAALRALRERAAEVDSGHAIIEAINKDVGPIHVRDTPLALVIDLAGDQAGVNVVVNWSAFDKRQNAADRGRWVTADLGRMPLRALLEYLFLGSGDPVRLTYAMDDNVIVVGSNSKLPIRLREARAYDLAPLLAAFADYRTSHDVRPTRLGPASHPEYAQQAMEFLELMAKEIAAPGDNWSGGGGDTSKVDASGTRLMIVAPSGTLSDLDRLFGMLRQFARSSIKRPPADPRFLAPCDVMFDRMKAPLKGFTLDRASLPEAFSKLEAAAGVTICLDPRVPTWGAPAGEPITLRFSNVPFYVALREILRASNGSLGYGIDEGMIFVTDHPARWPVTRIYDIRDLVEQSINRRVLAQSHQLPMANVRVPDVPVDLDNTATEPIQQLIGAIEGSVDRQTWRDAGGNAGSIREFAGWLIIRQTPESHMKIESFIETLRAGGRNG